MAEKRRPLPTRRTTPLSPRETERDGKVQVDWKAYFLQFCAVHGEPVEVGGRLLFRDGWTYSLTDYEGPEWGPPLNHTELDELVYNYWRARREKLLPLLATLTHRLQQFKDLSATRSLPVQQVVIVNTAQGKRRGYQPLSTKPLEDKVGWVRKDIEECEVRLKEIMDEFERHRQSANKESA